MALEIVSALNLQAASYVRHPLHGEERAWGEKNCYVDVWIEAVHALGLDPHAMLPFTVTLDFEGDQWTFYKPPHADLRALYGVDVHELNVWRPLLAHALEHVGSGKLVFTEADAFWLPDTQGTDYRRQHTKTTIVIETLDVPGRRLGYFHNRGYYALGGEDFAALFRLDAPPDPTFMPLFAEYARIDRRVRHPDGELAQRSVGLLREHLKYRPAKNPFALFAQSFPAELEVLKGESLPTYHAYAFATLRQIGSNFELTAAYLRWLEERLKAPFASAAAALDDISQVSQALILKGARAVAAKKAVDFGPMLEQLRSSWERAFEQLDRAL